MNKTELKEKIKKTLDSHKAEILALAKDIASEPELGFKEEKTAAKIKNIFAKYNIPYQDKLALTGVKGLLKGKTDKYTVAIIGELDAVPSPSHPQADKETGAAHACGHNIQLAIMAACAITLQTSGVMPYLSGNIVPFAVPAEEYVEITYRNNLRKAGKIKYLCGKSELIRLGAFDDIDMAMMMHVGMEKEQKRVIDTNGTSNGFIGKLIQFQGQAAHAAGAPHEGINALNAAMVALNAVNALRETFREADYVRFHPIITKGGESVNVVPSDVRMESYVRAKTVDAMLKSNEKINNALKYGAKAVGATAVIEDLPGQLPMLNNPELNAIYEENVKAILGEKGIIHNGHIAGSTDMGDVGHIMPVIHPWYSGGTKGVLHSADFCVTDDEMSYFIPALTMLDTVVDLLADDGQGAGHVLDNYQPIFTKKTYLEYMEKISRA